MLLRKPNEDWFVHHINNDDFEARHTDKAGLYALTPHLAADVFKPLLINKYRYEPTEKAWYEFTGTCWKSRQSLFNLLKHNLGDMKSQCQASPKKAGASVYGWQQIFNGRFIPAVQAIMEKDIDFHFELEDFDTNNLILNTPDGTWNLLEYDDYPNSPTDFCRHITSIAPQDDEDGKNCPYYLRHLDFMCQGDMNIRNYLEEISGYICTGKTSLQQFYWFYGLQNNGKSTLAAIWMHILGSYGWTAAQNQFAHRNQEPHSEQDLRLAGKRYVLVEELKGKWNAEKIKGCLSGNRIQAAEKGGKTTSFQLKCKLLFTSNNKPDVDPNDGGLARRMHLSDFPKQIPEEMHLDNFEETYLRPEAPFILNRMLKNAHKVLLTGKIIKPISVELATKNYFQSRDLIQQFMEDCIVIDATGLELAKDLLNTYNAWALDNGNDTISMAQFGKLLDKIGNYPKSHVGTGRGRSGLKIKDIWRTKAKYI